MASALCRAPPVALHASAPARQARAPGVGTLAARVPRHRLSQQRAAARLVVAASAAASFADAPALSVSTAKFPADSGVYAVFDKNGTLQYVGLSRKVNISVMTHLEALPELTHSVRVWELPGASKEELQEAWKQWVQQAVEATGAIPPGNAPGEKAWQQRRPRAARPEIRLTSGKGLDDLSCTVEFLIEQVVTTNKVVAFIKGTRTTPQCGFSHKVLTILNEVGADYEVVNVLDEVYNPGLREAIKSYSQWPTIPQIYVAGEFIGGADIVEEMHGRGELRQVVQAAAQAKQ